MATTHEPDSTKNPHQPTDNFETYQLPPRYYETLQPSQPPETPKKPWRNKLIALGALAGVGAAGTGIYFGTRPESSDAGAVASSRPSATAAGTPTPSPETLAPVPTPTAAPTPEATGNPYVQEQQETAVSQADALRAFAEQGYLAADFQKLLDPTAIEAVTTMYPSTDYNHGLGGAERVGYQQLITAESVTRTAQQLRAFLTNQYLAQRYPDFLPPAFTINSSPAQLAGPYEQMYKTTQAMNLDPTIDFSRIPNNDPWSWTAANFIDPAAPGLTTAQDIISVAPVPIEPPLDETTITPLYAFNAMIFNSAELPKDSLSMTTLVTINRDTSGEGAVDKIRYWGLMPVGDYMKAGPDGRMTPGSGGKPGDVFYPVVIAESLAQ